MLALQVLDPILTAQGQPAACLGPAQLGAGGIVINGHVEKGSEAFDSFRQRSDFDRAFVQAGEVRATTASLQG